MKLSREDYFYIERKELFMSLYDRWQGSELSVLEKELIFNRDNTGFVEYDTKDGRYFYLHPSPFLNSPKREIFCAESCDPPAEHTFVEVEIESEREFTPRGSQDRITVKTISGWKPFDPSPLAGSAEKLWTTKRLCTISPCRSGARRRQSNRLQNVPLSSRFLLLRSPMRWEGSTPPSSGRRHSGTHSEDR